RLQAVSSESTRTEIESAPPKAENGATTTTTRWQVEFTPTAELAERGINVNSVRARLQQLGQVVQAKPVVKGAGEIAFEFILATDAGETALASLAAEGLKYSPAPVQPAPRAIETQPVAAIAPASVVRVDLDRLDELMRIIGD